MRSQLLAAALLIAAAATQRTSAQVPGSADQPPAPGTEQGQGVLASVNGQAITATDLSTFLHLRAGPGVNIDAGMVHAVRRQIAEQILLAGEAERLGIALSDLEVEDYWEQYLGLVPDFESLAAEAGSTADRQRELARRSVLAEIFLYHKVGIWAEFGAYIKPDPRLEKFVDVTPGELREVFKQERERFDRPAAVSYTFYPCQDAAQAEGVRESLLAGGAIDDIVPGRERAPAPELPRIFAFSDELVAFLQTAVPGQISKVFETTLRGETRAVVFTIDDRQPALAADFAEIQDELRRYLQVNRLDLARRQLVSDVQGRAVFWPSELFDEPTGGQGDAAGGAGR